MAVVTGHTGWKLSIDEERHRTYKVKWLVKSLPSEGPSSVILALGLPSIGDPWTIPGTSEIDLDAWRHPNSEVQPVVKNEQGQYWTVEHTFSTKSLKECQSEQFEHPLLEPPIYDGSFDPVSREATNLRSSSHELIRGVEVDAHVATVEITKNVATLPLSTVSALFNHVHDGGTLFGVAGEFVKFSSFIWSQQFFGTCSRFYVVTFGFGISDWNSKEYDDWGTRLLNGRKRESGEKGEDECGYNHPDWYVEKVPSGDPSDDDMVCPNRFFPSHFVEAKDLYGDRIEKIPLQRGLPAEISLNQQTGIWELDQGTVLHDDAYPTGNLLQLGISSTIPGAA